MRTERDVAHHSDWHDRDYRANGCQDIIFARADNGSFTVDCEPDAIMCSPELIEAMRKTVGLGGHVRGNLLRIVCVNADLSYELERLACGCWLGRLLR